MKGQEELFLQSNFLNHYEDIRLVNDNTISNNTGNSSKASGKFKKKVRDINWPIQLTPFYNS